MNYKNTLLRGTIFLTAAGLASRFIGFFYRIFLANTIGAEGMGIYQLIFPVYSVCFSLCASGIETAVSKLTAEKATPDSPQKAFDILRAGLCITIVLALSCSVLLYNFAGILAEVYLKEPRCSPLLKILALTIPFGTIQSCFCGYYFGMHKAGVPSAAQVVEQTFRVLSVFFIYRLTVAGDRVFSPSVAVIGIVFGELCSFLFTITCFSLIEKPPAFVFPVSAYSHVKEILRFSSPLTLSRICVNLLASLEASMIPHALKAYGMDTASALSTYGIFTGMALPLVLFPNALTGSISLMLLPAVSETRSAGDFHALKITLQKIFSFCLVLGFLCLGFFLVFGSFLGSWMFSTPLAGQLITILAWICPFLYLNTTLSSVLNGLGYTGTTFFNGICNLFIRILFVFWGIPKLGIYGYLLGLLAGQLYMTIVSFRRLHLFLKDH